MLKVAFHNFWLSLRASHVRPNITKHFLLVVRPLSSHGVALDILVQILVWIQFGTGCRQREQLNPTRMLLHPTLDRLRLMHWMLIQDHEELSSCLADQSAQEPLQHGCTKGLLEDHESQMSVVGNRRDHVAAQSLAGTGDHWRATSASVTAAPLILRPQTHLV